MATGASGWTEQKMFDEAQRILRLKSPHFREVFDLQGQHRDAARRCYKELARIFHPDKLSNMSVRIRGELERLGPLDAVFKRISQAYEDSANNDIDDTPDQPGRPAQPPRPNGAAARAAPRAPDAGPGNYRGREPPRTPEPESEEESEDDFDGFENEPADWSASVRMILLQAFSSGRRTRYNFVKMWDSYRGNRAAEYYEANRKNVLAEAVAAFRAGPRVRLELKRHEQHRGWLRVRFAQDQADDEDNEGGHMDLADCILDYQGVLYWVTTMDDPFDENSKLIQGFSFDEGPLRASGSFAGWERAELRIFAGDYCRRYCSAWFLEENEAPVPELERAVLEPGTQVEGKYPEVGRFREELLQINQSQREAVRGIKNRAESIVGPPGAGKTTTVVHILDTKLPEKEVAIVTCVKNKTLDGVAEKLERFHCLPGEEALRMVVLGNGERLGEIANKYSLTTQVDEDPEVQRMKAEVRFWEGRFPPRHSELEGARRGLKEARRNATYKILQRSRVLLCTCSSAYQVAQLKRAFPGCLPPRLFMGILEEAGATPETYVPMLIAMGIQHLVMIGDPKQLKPMVLSEGGYGEIQGLNVDRSIMERAMKNGVKQHWLNVQYRMPRTLCELVSWLFYWENPLRTGHARPRDRNALRWIRVEGGHEVEVGTSRANIKEALEILRLLSSDRVLSRQTSKILIMAFNKPQAELLDQLVKHFLPLRQVCVMTVDGSQGNEEEHVILSTVRCNPDGDIGFSWDRHRICVALSRAKESLTIVGSSTTLQSDYRRNGRTFRKYEWRAIFDHFRREGTVQRGEGQGPINHDQRDFAERVLGKMLRKYGQGMLGR